MHGARVVSGKILSVTTDPGDFIEDENFSRAGDRCSQCCKFFEKFSFCYCQQSAEILTIGRFEDIWCRDLRHEQRRLVSVQSDQACVQSRGPLTSQKGVSE